MAACVRKTAPYRLIPSYYDFATHRCARRVSAGGNRAESTTNGKVAVPGRTRNSKNGDVNWRKTDSPKQKNRPRSTIPCPRNTRGTTASLKRRVIQQHRSNWDRRRSGRSRSDSMAADWPELVVRLARGDVPLPDMGVCVALPQHAIGVIGNAARQPALALRQPTNHAMR